eukprot:scaffold102605_cov21-Tisochrysis_lutea.AAC.1
MHNPPPGMGSPVPAQWPPSSPHHASLQGAASSFGSLQGRTRTSPFPPRLRLRYRCCTPWDESWWKALTLHYHPHYTLPYGPFCPHLCALPNKPKSSLHYCTGPVVPICAPCHTDQADVTPKELWAEVLALEACNRRSPYRTAYKMKGSCD